MDLEDLPEYIEHMRTRFLQDALATATAAYWRRRADDFDAATPRLDDWPGQATPEDIEAARYRNAAIALACRRHADLMLGGRL
jgi:hypothetical protein